MALHNLISLLFVVSLVLQPSMASGSSPSINILGTPLELCDPATGFFRSGYCDTGPMDYGTHTVCARVTSQFLDFTKSRGNDLSTPAPQYRFPGLIEGDKWCLCAGRWREAWEAGVAPEVVAEATHEKSLDFISKEVLLEHRTLLDNGNSR
eukprot:TRINITY_DN350_c0_g1_i2.p1 TRINITY_DN350_c0_g1~~TRINITY_DN350_c0_g1_i2.p1  ORF type:complete len:151 (-),score=7.31 TRINITY_DN350_c0_g1_i2:253-705(-)